MKGWSHIVYLRKEGKEELLSPGGREVEHNKGKVVFVGRINAPRWWVAFMKSPVKGRNMNSITTQAYLNRVAALME